METYIRPSADLRKNYNELSKLTREKRSAIAITVNGREDTVLINHALYRQQIEELDLLKAIAEGEYDFDNGRCASVDGMFDELRKEIKSRYEL